MQNSEVLTSDALALYCSDHYRLLVVVGHSYTGLLAPDRTQPVHDDIEVLIAGRISKCFSGEFLQEHID